MGATTALSVEEVRIGAHDERRGSAAADGNDTDTRTAADAMDVLRRLVHSLHSAKSDCETRLGVTAAQLFVLREIAKAGTLTVTELAQRTVTCQSSVSEVVTRLTARGLVTRGRSVEDRRRAELTLSDAGRELLTRAPESVQERLLSAFYRLPPHTRHAAMDGMKAWLDEAGLAEAEPTMFFESPPDRGVAALG